MGEAKAGVFLAALLLGAALWMGPAAAGEPADDPASWGAVSAVELERQRGGTDMDDVDGAAISHGSQTGTNTLNSGGGDVIAGAVMMGSHTFDNQVMSINAINTGNNVNMQNVMAIMVVIE